MSDEFSKIENAKHLCLFAKNSWFTDSKTREIIKEVAFDYVHIVQEFKWLSKELTELATQGGKINDELIETSVKLKAALEENFSLAKELKESQEALIESEKTLNGTLEELKQSLEEQQKALEQSVTLTKKVTDLERNYQELSKKSIEDGLNNNNLTKENFNLKRDNLWLTSHSDKQNEKMKKMAEAENRLKETFDINTKIWKNGSWYSLNTGVLLPSTPPQPLIDQVVNKVEEIRQLQLKVNELEESQKVLPELRRQYFKHIRHLEGIKDIIDCFKMDTEESGCAIVAGPGTEEACS